MGRNHCTDDRLPWDNLLESQRYIKAEMHKQKTKDKQLNLWTSVQVFNQVRHCHRNYQESTIVQRTLNRKLVAKWSDHFTKNMTSKSFEIYFLIYIIRYTLMAKMLITQSYTCIRSFHRWGDDPFYHKITTRQIKDLALNLI